MPSVFLYKPDARDLEARRRAAGWSLWVWLPAALAVVCIACESTGTFSAENTSGWLRPVIQSVFGSLDDAAWAELHHLIRKSCHFLGYGMVCLTFLRGWLLTFAAKPQLTYRSWRRRSCLAAILSTAAVASLDELHQTFLPSRTGQFSDVLLDTCGAAFLCLAMWLVCWRPRTWEPLH
jgi:VanZ family protein